MKKAELSPPLAPTAEHPEGAPSVGSHWRDLAACREVDPELFFPTSVSGSARIHEMRPAKQVCYHCPVATDCLRWALTTGLRYGIAGGLDETERGKLRQRGYGK